MKGAPRTRIRVETTLALTSSSTLAITLIWRTWIETLFSIDPDRHGGSLEWAIASALCVLTIAFARCVRTARLYPAIRDGIAGLDSRISRTKLHSRVRATRWRASARRPPERHGAANPKLPAG